MKANPYLLEALSLEQMHRITGGGVDDITTGVSGSNFTTGVENGSFPSDFEIDNATLIQRCRRSIQCRPRSTANQWKKTSHISL